ncbi:MAG: DUF1405 domain-containing protein [Candidatus Altiarchaeota archaeon]|nr:DUF1405 domain-containing protein [Candidatus Altiarchaeota archaeon]
MISYLGKGILESKPLLLFLILLNFLGFLFGVYYYMPQLDETPQWLWLVVIDCPLYVLLFAIILLFELLSRPLPDVLKFITSVGLFKYGVWTVIVVLLHFDYFFSINPVVYGLILPMHVGMALESLVLLNLFRPTRSSTLLVALFFVLNDVSDYVYGTLPRIPETWVSLLFIESLLVSVLLPSVIYRGLLTKGIYTTDV